MKSGIFVNYQMAEVFEFIEKNRIDLSTFEGKRILEKQLEEVLKPKWLNDKIPGLNRSIGDSMPGMQDITVEDVIRLSIGLKQSDTYTVQNSGMMNYCVEINEDGTYKKNEDGTYKFNFDKLKKIAKLAKDNEKKIIIDSAVVFGDLDLSDTPPDMFREFKKLDGEAIKKMISDYINALINALEEDKNIGADVIERIDVLNAIFKRDDISKGNVTEQFWIEKIGVNYAQEVLDIVRKSIDSRFSGIKLCWNEFYLTRKELKIGDKKVDLEERKKLFLEKIGMLKNLDVVGIQDRFMSGEDITYITNSLGEIANVCNDKKKEVSITEFSCSVSSQEKDGKFIVEDVNKKISILLETIRNYCRNNNIIKSIEGAFSDKFDYNHHELLKKFKVDISTTGKKDSDNLERQYTHQIKRINSFTRRHPIEAEIFKYIVEKNKIIRQNKIQRELMKKSNVKSLSYKKGDLNRSGFVNTIILSLIVSFMCVVIFMITYALIRR